MQPSPLSKSERFSCDNLQVPRPLTCDGFPLLVKPHLQFPFPFSPPSPRSPWIPVPRLLLRFPLFSTLLSSFLCIVNIARSYSLHCFPAGQFKKKRNYLAMFLPSRLRCTPLFCWRIDPYCCRIRGCCTPDLLGLELMGLEAPALF